MADHEKPRGPEGFDLAIDVRGFPERFVECASCSSDSRNSEICLPGGYQEPSIFNDFRGEARFSVLAKYEAFSTDVEIET